MSIVNNAFWHPTPAMHMSKVIDENGNFEFFTDALAKFTQMC